MIKVFCAILITAPFYDNSSNKSSKKETFLTQGKTKDDVFESGYVFTFRELYFMLQPTFMNVKCNPGIKLSISEGRVNPSDQGQGHHAQQGDERLFIYCTFVNWTTKKNFNLET